jgi:hypothetical protein
MERNTITTLGQLREGDRFTYPRRVDVWQVVGIVGKHVEINQFLPWGDPIHKYAQLKKGNVVVKFLRHTLPLPGEECLLTDLQENDVFYFPSDVIAEFIVVEKFILVANEVHDGRVVVKRFPNDGELLFFWQNEVVVFVRKEIISQKALEQGGSTK